MKSINLIIKHKGGLHARPAGQLVGVSGQFNCNVELEYNGKTAAVKSILKVLSLAIPEKASFTVNADGPEEESAVTAIKTFIESLD